MIPDLSRRAFLALPAALAAPAQTLTSYLRRSTVSLVSGQDRRKNVYEALLAIDDQIRPALKRKKYVFLKPNCVAVKNQLGSTHADALRGILDYLAPRFRGPVVIAESSRDETWDAYENFGYRQVCREYRQVKLVDLNEEEKYEVADLVDANLHLMQVRLAARMFDPDAFLLGSAILKSHDVAVSTLSVKNLCLAAPLHNSKRQAEKFHDKTRYHAGHRQMHMNILLTAKRLRPFWGATVIDGYEGMEGNGPLRGTPVPSRLAVASTDLVAADRVALDTMGVDPAWVGYLNFCWKAGLGQFDLAQIDLRANARLDDVRRKYKLHSTIERQLEWMTPLKRG